MTSDRQKLGDRDNLVVKTSVGDYLALQPNVGTFYSVIFCFFF